MKVNLFTFGFRIFYWGYPAFVIHQIKNASKAPPSDDAE